jgi:hypothetical protein
LRQAACATEEREKGRFCGYAAIEKEIRYFVAISEVTKFATP